MLALEATFIKRVSVCRCRCVYDDTTKKVMIFYLTLWFSVFQS